MQKKKELEEVFKDCLLLVGEMEVQTMELPKPDTEQAGGTAANRTQAAQLLPSLSATISLLYKDWSSSQDLMAVL